MSLEKDSYKTILKPSTEILYKEKGSKFFGYAYPVASEDSVKEILEQLKKKHHGARHWCYAWQLGKQYDHYRVNDDGEPSNSAGMPIYGQIQSFDLTNVLVVVMRYFGGTKLGVGGLIQAYKTAAKMALENARIVTRTLDDSFVIKCGYDELNTVMRIIKSEDLRIVNQELGLDCRTEITVRRKDSDRVYELFEALHKISIKRS